MGAGIGGDRRRAVRGAAGRHAGRQLTRALWESSAQYERERTQHAAQIAALQRQVEHYAGQVTCLIADYRTLAETLRGRWN